MMTGTGASGPRIERELLVVLAIAVLVPVIGVIFSAARSGSADPPALVAAPTAMATALPPTPEPTAPPTPTPFIPVASEYGVAAVALVPASDTAGAAGGANFPPPPPRASASPRSNGGIARVVSRTLQIDHYVEVVGIANNQMQTPQDGTYAIGWYDTYDRPGSGGNVIVSAHETWNHKQGPFYALHRATTGDEIAIQMTDGTRYRYVVFSNVRYSVADIPMREIIWPTKRPRGEEWLTLITCGGRIVYNDRGFGDYLDRDVVIARRVN